MWCMSVRMLNDNYICAVTTMRTGPREKATMDGGAIPHILRNTAQPT